MSWRNATLRFTNVGASIFGITFPSGFPSLFLVYFSSNTHSLNPGFQWEPYANVNADDYGKKTLTGLLGFMLDLIVKSLNLRYVVHFPNDRQWGIRLPNGSWTGMIGDLSTNVRSHKSSGYPSRLLNFDHLTVG